MPDRAPGFYEDAACLANAEIRRLRSQLRAAEDEATSYKARFEAAVEEIRQLRTRIPGGVSQAAAPRQRETT